MYAVSPLATPSSMMFALRRGRYSDAMDCELEDEDAEQQPAVRLQVFEKEFSEQSGSLTVGKAS